MGSAPLTEKLHTACDECRTRKLKCSGGKPVCGRCQREAIACVYSPQKTMGRPRKRRREGEAGAEVASATTQNELDSSYSDSFSLQQSRPSSYGLASPPEFVDVTGGNEMYVQAEIDPAFAGIYGSAPPMSSADFGLTPPIDPSLWDLNMPMQNTHATPPVQHTPPSLPDVSPQGPCTCLSLTYLTLTDLQTVPTFSFPQVIIPLRKAMTTISSLIYCPTCPLDPFSAIQNVSALGSLFKALVERFSKVLSEVDAEARGLAASGEKKPFLIGDNNPALGHLHTGTPDCPMGFNVELEPETWRKLVKQALRTEVHGGGSNVTPLQGLLEESQARQQRWHEDKEFWGEERKRMFGDEKQCKGSEGRVCQSLGTEHIKATIWRLDWS